MWNYLVYNLSSRIVVQPAMQDYTGFSVKVKRMFNLCDCTGGRTATLTLHITRSGQPTTGVVVRPVQQQTTQNQATEDQEVRKPLINRIPYALGFYVGVVPQNTYIERHTDKGGFGQHNQNIVHYGSDADDGISYQLSQLNYSGGGAQLQAHITYNFSAADCGQTICSAQLKILPVMLSGQISVAETSPGSGEYTANVSEVTSPTQSLGLAQYASYRKKDADLSDSQLDMSNRWQIQTSWQGGCTTADASDATYYRTSYNLYPSLDIFQSVAQNMVNKIKADEQSGTQ